MIIRKFVAALIAGSGVLAMADAAPALATPVEQQAGAFVGARLRIALGGAAPAKPRLDLTFAPTLRAQLGSGRVVTRFGDGAAFGIGAGRATPSLLVGGRTISSLTAARSDVDKTRAGGISTLGYVAIGVGVAVVVGGFVFYRAMENASE